MQGVRLLLSLVGLPLGGEGSRGGRGRIVAAEEHPFRRRLMDLVRRRPGIRLADLWRTLNANRKTTKYHLMILERANTIVALRGPRLSRYFPRSVPSEERPALSLLLRGRVLELVQLVAQNPGVTQRELTAKLSMSRKVLREYADLLVETRLVEEHRAPHSRRYYPTERLAQILAKCDSLDPAGPSEDRPPPSRETGP